MNELSFTNIRSLLEALAKALNLINPAVENHHEQAAYFAYFIGRELGYEEEELHTIVYAALLHDLGSIILERPASIEEIESHASEYAHIGAEMIRDLPGFEKIAAVIEHCQTDWATLVSESAGSGCERCVQLAAVIHLGDVAATCLDPTRRILGQVERICNIVRAGSGTEFMPEAVDALISLKDYEVIWLDAANNPDFLLFFTGEFHRISLQKTAELTRLMSRIIDYRSAFTAMHSAGVAASARELARLCGMSQADCLKMEIAGNLHDVGKLVVPREILEKPGKLDEAEFSIIREHTYYTRLVLMDIEGFQEIADWAAYHHEKLNGRGYPFHLDRTQLDLGARIMAVADIFSAITEDRPYRRGMPREKVIAVLRENAEKDAIDGELVETLIAHYDEVDAARAKNSREAGKRYYDSLRGAEA
ncbi:MAG: HD domain-containing protein [Oscillospiraceae bacterium]|nr:HD domain-containing protein [Oscillospiraceae bacterium]